MRMPAHLEQRSGLSLARTGEAEKGWGDADQGGGRAGGLKDGMECRSNT